MSRRTLEPDDRAHGTAGGYFNHRCRCAPCRSAGTAYTTKRRTEREPLAPDDPRHGMASTYVNWKCQCPRCAAAYRQAQRAYDRRRRVRKLWQHHLRRQGCLVEYGWRVKTVSARKRGAKR